MTLSWLKRLVIGALFLLSCISVWAQTPKATLQVQFVGVNVALQTTLTDQLSLVKNQSFALGSPVRLRMLAVNGRKEIKTVLQTQGYFHSKIHVDVQAKKARHWQVTYRISLGSPTVLQHVYVAITGPGKKVKRLARLVKHVPFKVGQRLNQARYQAFKTKLQNRAIDMGFFDAHYSQHQIKVYVAQSTASIDLVLATGERYHFGTLHFAQRGYQFDTAFLKRMVFIKPGQAYNGGRIRLLRNDLYGSDYFADVDVVTQVNKKTRQVDVKIHTRAKKPGQYTVGVGYGTETGPRALLGWKWRHITNTGQYFVARTEFSKLYVNFGASYVIPGANPLSDYTSLNVGQNYTDITPYQSLETLFGISWVKQLSAWRITLGIHQHFVRYTPQGATRNTAKYLIPRVSVTYTDEQPDGYWHQGVEISTDIYGAEKMALSDNSFLTGVSIIHWSLPLSRNNRIFTEWLAGATASTGPITNLATTLRFYAGGVDNVRGYDYKSLSPTVNGNLIGGRYTYLARISFEHHLFQKFSALVFYNVGSAFNDVQHMVGDQGAGLGVAWRSPVGPLQLFFSRPVWHDNDRSWRVDFSIGSRF